MIPQLGAPVGLFVASALFVYLITGLSEADFLEWGWRYPFFVAFAINVVALFARLRIVVTPGVRGAVRRASSCSRRRCARRSPPRASTS